MVFFKKTFKKIHDVVDTGSTNVENLVKKAEKFVDQTEELLKSSDNSIKIIAGFVITSMGLQMLASYSQLRVNMKMLALMKGVKK